MKSAKRFLYCSVLALLFNALSPTLFASALLNSHPGKILLCTSSGYQWVKTDQLSEVSDVLEVDSQSSHCVLCSLSDESDGLPYGVMGHFVYLRATMLFIHKQSYALSAGPQQANNRSPPIFS